MLAETPAAPQEAQLTPKQQRYLSVLLSVAEAGGVPKQKDCAKRARVSEWQVSRWNHDPAFTAALAQALKCNNEPLTELLWRDCAMRAMRTGSVKHFDLCFRYSSRNVVPEPALGERTGQPGGNAIAAVTFVGLPQPPTPAQAEQMRPPVGSNVIITPQIPGLPPAGGKK